MTLVQIKSDDLQSATFSANYTELLNEAGAEIANELGDVILSESTAPWVIEIIPISDEDKIITISDPDIYNSPYTSSILNEAGDVILNEAGSEILGEDADVFWPIELIQV